MGSFAVLVVSALLGAPGHAAPRPKLTAFERELYGELWRRLLARDAAPRNVAGLSCDDACPSWVESVWPDRPASAFGGHREA